MQNESVIATRGTARVHDKTAAQKAVEFMSQLAGFAPIRSARSHEVEAVRNLVHGHLVAAVHPMADLSSAPEGVDLLRVRWGGAGAESAEHFSELLAVAIVQSARHEETIGEVEDARARALQLAAHFRNTYGVLDFALF
ncbi:MAG: hypothetical protein EHM87_07860 [Burkholderiales bacterium]|nr:MAG: hypothetical protein EHM87_07860 [Burkholderiales bacterium]